MIVVAATVVVVVVVAVRLLYIAFVTDEQNRHEKSLRIHNSSLLYTRFKRVILIRTSERPLKSVSVKSGVFHAFEPYRLL